MLSCRVSVSALAAVSTPFWRAVSDSAAAEFSQPNAGSELRNCMRVAQIDIAERQRAGGGVGYVELPVRSGRSVIACKAVPSVPETSAATTGASLLPVTVTATCSRGDAAMMVVDLHRIGQRDDSPTAR